MADADIVLADCRGQGWLVRGEQHMDNLLRNILDPDVTIEVIRCESNSAVEELWNRWNVADPSNMWMIHPAIMGRVQGRPAFSTITFAPWSAQIDKEGTRVIDVVAKAAGEKPGLKLTITRGVPEGVDTMAADLANIRYMLIEARLKEAGVEAERLVRAVRVAESPEDAERYILIVK